MIASLTLGIYQLKPMNTATLKRQRKDEIIEKLLATAKENSDQREKVMAAGIIGGIAGTLLGIALATM